MMFESTTDDEDNFFTPASSSNLASLFGVTNMSHPNKTSGNVSLTYTAPKQPTNKANETSKKEPVKHQSTVLVFKEVYAFKLIEKNYINQGKCGFALVGNDNVHLYQLLLYKQKNDIISMTKLTPEFQFIVQKDNYCSFSDDNKHDWAIHFSSETDLNDFLKVIESRGTKVVRENLDTSKGMTNLKINYTQEPELEKDFQKQSDSEQSDTSGNNMKANILSRMAKMGQKILPNNNLSDGTDSDTDKDKSLQNKGRRSKKSSITGVSITSSNDISHPQSEVAGAAISVPLVPQPYNFVNSQYIPFIQPQVPQIVPFTSDLNSAYNKNQLPVENITSPVMYTPAAPIAAPYQFDQMQMYFSENRTHNSEIRMNILRLTNKMDEVLDKFQKIEVNSNIASTSDTNSNKEILHEENEKLKMHLRKLEKEIKRLRDIEAKRSTELIGKETPVLEENEELKKLLEKHIEKEKEYLQKIKVLEIKLKDVLELENSKKLQNENNDKSNHSKDKYDNIDEIIKKIMNSLYQDINNQILDDESIFGRDVKKILAQKIVDNTYSIIAVVSELSFTKRRENETE